jgi:hypothetical protein
MQSKRGILTVFVAMIVAFLVFLPCSVAQDNSDQNQPPKRMGMERPGQRPGPGLEERGERGGPGERSGGRGGPGERRGGGQRFDGRPDSRWRRPDLTDDQIDSVLKELEKRDPNTVKQLTELRTKDPEKFMTELRRAAGPEIGRIMMRSWALRRQTEFLQWLEDYVPKEAEDLARLKEKEPDLYTQKYELAWRRWGRIYDQTQENPELAKVLVADFQLRERQHELQNNYRSAQNEEEKNDVMAQLEEIVSDRYDLIIRQKQMEYEQLLKRLEALQNEVKASLKDIESWKDPDNKEKSVKERLKYLTEGRPQWPDRL